MISNSKGSNFNLRLSYAAITVFLTSSCAVAAVKPVTGRCLGCPHVVTSRGTVLGSYEVSRSGRTYMAFRSIPYAQAPVGHLRFASPQAMLPWRGIRNVTADPPYCTQYNVISSEDFDENSYFGQEDCLYLSVFTRQTDNRKKKAVMAYIHGGGFESWSGARMHGPEYFMDHDIVTVFINYRLGPFGFFSTEDSVIPGNYGLKDQLMALRWIRENIAKFGGDPDCVTLFGQSAGAASVHYHMKSSQSVGLFVRAIMNTGSVYNPWAMVKPGTAKERALKSAVILSCPNDDSKSLITCLRNKPTGEIIKLRKHFVEWDTDPFVIFGPVVERNGGFFTRNDLDRKTNIPLLTGINAAEGAIKVAALLSRSTDYLSQLFTEFDKWAPITFGYGLVGQHTDISTAVKQQYFSDTTPVTNLSLKVAKNLTQIYTDAWFLSGYHRALKDHRGKLFRYKLDRKPYVSFIELLPAKYPPEVGGASHSDDLIFLFNLNRTIPLDLLDNEDLRISKIMVTLWSNFIIHGSPGETWEPTCNNGEQLIITSDGRFTMSKEAEEEKNTSDFWNRIEKKVEERRNQLNRASHIS